MDRLGAGGAEAFIRRMKYSIASSLSMPQIKTGGDVSAGVASAEVMFITQKLYDDEEKRWSSLPGYVSQSYRDSIRALGLPFRVMYDGLSGPRDFTSLLREVYSQYLVRRAGAGAKVREVGTVGVATTIYTVFPKELKSPMEMRSEMKARGAYCAYVVLPNLRVEGGHSKVMAANYRKYLGAYNFTGKHEKFSYATASYTGYLRDDDVRTEKGLFHTRIMHITPDWFIVAMCDLTPDCHPNDGLAEVHRSAYDLSKTRVIVPYGVKAEKLRGVVDVRDSPTCCAGCYAEAKVVIIGGPKPDPPFPNAELAYETIPEFTGGDIKGFLITSLLGHKARTVVRDDPDGFCYTKLIKPEKLNSLDVYKMTSTLSSATCNYISRECSPEDFVDVACLTGVGSNLHVSLNTKDGGLIASGYRIFSLLASCLLLQKGEGIGELEHLGGYCWLDFMQPALRDYFRKHYDPVVPDHVFMALFVTFGYENKGFMVTIEGKVSHIFVIALAEDFLSESECEFFGFDGLRVDVMAVLEIFLLGNCYVGFYGLVVVARFSLSLHVVLIMRFRGFSPFYDLFGVIWRCVSFEICVLCSSYDNIGRPVVWRSLALY